MAQVTYLGHTFSNEGMQGGCGSELQAMINDTTLEYGDGIQQESLSLDSDCDGLKVISWVRANVLVVGEIKITATLYSYSLYESNSCTLAEYDGSLEKELQPPPAPPPDLWKPHHTHEDADMPSSLEQRWLSM